MPALAPPTRSPQTPARADRGLECEVIGLGCGNRMRSIRGRNNCASSCAADPDDDPEFPTAPLQGLGKRSVPVTPPEHRPARPGDRAARMLPERTGEHQSLVGLVALVIMGPQRPRRRAVGGSRVVPKVRRRTEPARLPGIREATEGGSQAHGEAFVATGAQIICEQPRGRQENAACCTSRACASQASTSCEPLPEQPRAGATPATDQGLSLGPLW